MNPTLRQAVEAAVKKAWGHTTTIAQVTPLTGDASSRSYARLLLKETGPHTVVVMILAGSGLSVSSDELAVFTEPLKELPYLNVYRFLQPLGVRVPETYYDGSQEGFLLLEDIGDMPLREAATGKSAQEIEQLYRQAIDQLVLLQVEGTRRRAESCIAFQQRFDHRLFMWEFEHFIEWGLEKREGKPLPDGEARELRTMFDQISSVLDQAPAYLNHRDYHSWNLFVQNGEIRVIDFQDALLAPVSYDLETLLNDRDTPTIITPTLEQALVKYYHAAWMERGGGALTLDQLWEEYNLCLLQKACKVVGRFYFLELEKGKTGYSRYIPPTLATIRRVVARLPQYHRLQDIIAVHFPE
ncbi:MAG TPA: phosphotransferase [Methylomirabilota bacterium]|nr:phosphotransferase [Methylomirabilota bacterium]